MLPIAQDETADLEKAIAKARKLAAEWAVLKLRKAERIFETVVGTVGSRLSLEKIQRILHDLCEASNSPQSLENALCLIRILLIFPEEYEGHPEVQQLWNKLFQWLREKNTSILRMLRDPEEIRRYLRFFETYRQHEGKKVVQIGPVKRPEEIEVQAGAADARSLQRQRDPTADDGEESLQADGNNEEELPNLVENTVQTLEEGPKETELQGGGAAAPSLQQRDSSADYIGVYSLQDRNNEIMQGPLEGEAEGVAMQRSDAGLDAFVAESAKDQESLERKGVEHPKQAPEKSKKEKKKGQGQKKVDDVKRGPSNSEQLQVEFASSGFGDDVVDADNGDSVVGTCVESEIPSLESEEEPKLCEQIESQNQHSEDAGWKVVEPKRKISRMAQ